MLLQSSPQDGFYIEQIITCSKGFIVCGDNGQMMVYEKTEDPYSKLAQWPSNDGSKQEKGEDQSMAQLMLQIMGGRVKALTLNSSEDTVIFTTENNQIMKCKVNLERANDETRYEFLMNSFHSRAITGLDVCIKKELIVTCSEDKSIRIWNYAEKRLEIFKMFQDQCHSVAFHPSGFHIVVGMSDKVRMMNVFQHTVEKYKELHIKQCKEIRFSNGGHLFAAVNGQSVNVFNFYTGECKSDHIYKDHKGNVQSVSWFEDDSGLVTTGLDGYIYIWELNNNERPWYQYSNKTQGQSQGANFPCVEKSADNQRRIFAVGQDKTLREIHYEDLKDKGQQNQGLALAISQQNAKKEAQPAVEKRRFESSVQFSSVVSLKEGRGLIVGTSANDRPGSILIFRLENLTRVFECQAHSLPISRMRVNFENNYLFSASKDGSLGIWEIKDSKYKRDKDAMSITYSKQILTPSQELRELEEQIKQLERDNREIEQHNKL